MIKRIFIFCLCFVVVSVYGAIYFDGANDKITVTLSSNTFAPLNNACAIMFWMYIDPVHPAGDYIEVVYQREGPGDYIGISVLPNRADGKVYIIPAFRGTGGNAGAAADFSVFFGTNTRGEWHHYAVVRPKAGTTDTIFAYMDLNRLAAGTRIAANEINPKADMLIGADGTNYDRVIIDDYVMIVEEYGKNIDFASVIARHYQRKWQVTPATVIYLPMDEPFGDCMDLSGYGNTGHLYQGTRVGGAPILQVR